MTVADSAVIEKPMSDSGGRAVVDGSMPGTWTRIGVDGLKPSLRFHSVGSRV